MSNIPLYIGSNNKQHTSSRDTASTNYRPALLSSNTPAPDRPTEPNYVSSHNTQRTVSLAAACDSAPSGEGGRKIRLEISDDQG